MARGLEKQLDRCPSSNPQPTPDFCSFPVVYNNAKNAYNSLWDAIEENKDYLSDSVELGIQRRRIYPCAFGEPAAFTGGWGSGRK